MAHLVSLSSSLSSYLDIYSPHIILIMYYVEQCYTFPVSTFIHSKHMQLISPKKICLENQVFIPSSPHQVILFIVMNRSLLGFLATIRWYLYAIDSFYFFFFHFSFSFFIVFFIFFFLFPPLLPLVLLLF